MSCVVNTTRQSKIEKENKEQNEEEGSIYQCDKANKKKIRFKIHLPWTYHESSQAYVMRLRPAWLEDSS
jgi:hypothetical protein